MTTQRWAEHGACMPRLLLRLLIPAALLSACASPAPDPRYDPENVLVSLTAEGDKRWRLDDERELSGHVTVVVRDADVATVQASRGALLREFGGIVAEQNFRVAFLCEPDLLFGDANQRPSEEWQKRRAELRRGHQEMVARLNRALPRPVVKDVKCSLGWTRAKDAPPPKRKRPTQQGAATGGRRGGHGQLRAARR